MLRLKIVSLCVLVLIVFFTACKSESPATPANDSATLPTMETPSRDEALKRTGEASGESSASSAAQESDDTMMNSKRRSGTEPTHQADPQKSGADVEADPAPTPTRLPPTPDPDADLAAIRLIIEEYWAALNDYDVDHAITMLEENYRTAEEELIRKDIGRMKLFRVKLGVTEQSAPTLKDDGDYETYLSLKTPIDTRRVLMVFRRIQGQWWIVFSGEVE